MNLRTKQRGALAAPIFLVTTLALAACSPGDIGGGNDSTAGASGGSSVELSYLVDNADSTVAQAKALVAAFTAANPDIKITIDTRPSGADGDNIVKTKLATGDMADVFDYNAGSLLRALDPVKNIVPVTDESWTKTIDDGFKASVTIDGQVYGAPFGPAMGGGVLYNKKVFDSLGLSVPTTWAEFSDNNAKIKAAGIDPVIQTYADTWTSQLFVLADFHNVSAAKSDWADKYTANDPAAKYTKDPAINGFNRLEAVSKAGYLNPDFASMTFDQGLQYLSDGKGAQYPMLTFALTSLITLDPANAENIGFFGLPGDDEATNGMTLWEPAATYIPTTTKGDKLAAAKKFSTFIAGAPGCDAMNSVAPPTGPYVNSECKLPTDVPKVVKDMQAYVDAGTATPALEFLSPVKGPNLEKLTVEVGSGISSAADGASRYDDDVKNQALQLGLPGW
jgi:raffinose/stachyose/melibiose transport system substrate-binding protein